jgi:hypothetical protein
MKRRGKGRIKCMHINRARRGLRKGRGGEVEDDRCRSICVCFKADLQLVQRGVLNFFLDLLGLIPEDGKCEKEKK